MKYKTVWISDIHLGALHSQVHPLFLFLKELKCDELFLVGDIIDGWKLKQRFYFPQSHVNVLFQLLKKTKRGTKVYYVIGNHDEFLKPLLSYLDCDEFSDNLMVSTQFDYTSVHNKKLLVVHGDEFDTIVKYHKYIAVLGDKLYDMLLHLNHFVNNIRKVFGWHYWSLSKYLKLKVKNAVNFIFEFENALARECKLKKYDGVVCGHIHHGEIKKIGEVMYFNDGDWVESCTALVETHKGEFKLLEVKVIDNKVTVECLRRFNFEDSNNN